jgi:hypothetical protein
MLLFCNSSCPSFAALLHLYIYMTVYKGFVLHLNVHEPALYLEMEAV